MVFSNAALCGHCSSIIIIQPVNLTIRHDFNSLLVVDIINDDTCSSTVTNRNIKSFKPLVLLTSLRFFSFSCKCKDLLGACVALRVYVVDDVVFNRFEVAGRLLVSVLTRKNCWKLLVGMP